MPMPKAHEPRRTKPIRSPSWPDNRIGDSGSRNDDDRGIGDDGDGSTGKGINGNSAGAGIIR